MSDPVSLETAVPVANVRSRALSSTRPRLSLLAVRWGGTPETAVDTSAFNWGSTNSSVSSTYSNMLFKVRFPLCLILPTVENFVVSLILKTVGSGCNRSA